MRNSVEQVQEEHDAYHGTVERVSARVSKRVRALESSDRLLNHERSWLVVDQLHEVYNGAVYDNHAQVIEEL